MVSLFRLQRIVFAALAVLAFALAALATSAHGTAMTAGNEMMMSAMSGQSGMAMACDDVSPCDDDSNLCYFVCVTSGAVLAIPMGWNQIPAPPLFWRSFAPASPSGLDPSPGDRPPKFRLL